MNPGIRVYLYDKEGMRFFGEGPYKLLCLIEETGSLRSAAIKMNMAYTKALSLIKHAETALGFSLTRKNIGGIGGGGSILTPEAKNFLEKYETYRKACYEANSRIYHEVFSDQS